MTNLHVHQASTDNGHEWRDIMTWLTDDQVSRLFDQLWDPCAEWHTACEDYAVMMAHSMPEPDGRRAYLHKMSEYASVCIG